VDELHSQHGLGIPELADFLDRSPAWVRVRLGTLKDMPQSIRFRIMSGQFPFRNYVYSLKQRTRVRDGSKKEMVAFVGQVSGKGLSTRDIDLLAKGYFNGNPDMKAQIMEGKLDWTLDQLKHQEQMEKTTSDFDGMSESEEKAMRQLRWAFFYINRIPGVLSEYKFENLRFFKAGAEITNRILKRTAHFISILNEFHDRAAKTLGCNNTSSGR
jgi:hypothetical protein